VAHGRCTFQTATGNRHDVGAGDILLMPFTDDHMFWNGDATETVSALDIVQPGPIEGMLSMTYGGGGEATRLVCGYLESSEFLFAPVFRALPQVLIEHTGDDRFGELLASTVREILALAASARPGSQMMLGRLMEILFLEVLRRHVARLPSGSQGWLAAINDPIVSRALQLVHADPGKRWTADSLAREAGSSRTVLTERFNALLGRPPIDYITSWRIQLAAQNLRGSNASIRKVAADVGYESEAAFNRAFKRVTGTTPGRWRDGVSADPFASSMPNAKRAPKVTARLARTGG
jgi:AraC-like DNA-binding protein